MTLGVRALLKSALLWFVAGIALGVGLLIYKGLWIRAIPHWLRLAHTHMLMVGFFVQLVMGVAYWMFPRVKVLWLNEQRALIMAWLLNGGLLLRFIAEPFHGRLTGEPFPGAGPWIGWIMTVSALSQLAAVVMFAIGMWPRIRAASGMVAGGKTRKPLNPGEWPGERGGTKKQDG